MLFANAPTNLSEQIPTATTGRPEGVRLSHLRRRSGQEPRRAHGRQLSVSERDQLRVRAALRLQCRRTRPSAVLAPTSTTRTSMSGMNTGPSTARQAPRPSFQGYAEGMEWKRHSTLRTGPPSSRRRGRGHVRGRPSPPSRRSSHAVGSPSTGTRTGPSADKWAEPLRHEDLARLVRHS